MKTTFSEFFKLRFRKGLEKTDPDRSAAARLAWQKRERAAPEKPKAEKPQPKGEPPSPEFGPGFGTPKGPVEMFTQEDLLRIVPKNEKGEQYFAGANVKLIERVFNFDPAETGLKTIVVQRQQKDPNIIEKKYHYTDAHVRAKAHQKFAKAERLVGHIEPIRERFAKDMNAKDPETRAAATICKMIDQTYMRIGGSKAEERTGSSGASTLRAKHMTDMGEKGIRVQFIGKSGVEWDRMLTNPEIVRSVREFSKGKKGEDLIFPVSPGQVNRYLKENTKRVGKGGITAKDFRTFHASRICLEELQKNPPPATIKEAKEHIKAAIEYTAAQLGHTPSVCRNKYVNPAIIESYLEKAVQKKGVV